MVIRHMLLRSRNNCFLKKLSITQNSVISSDQLLHYYPSLLNINNYSYSGLILPTSNYQNHKIQKLFSSQIDVRSKNPEDIKEISSSSNNECNKKKDADTPVLTKKEKLKKALKEYGAIVIVFHMGISLISLGTFYLLVSSGLDVAKIIEATGLDRWITKSDLAASAGTFAVSYAIHKVFAPVRITITLGAVPFIVRYLRKAGFLKK